jgi:ribosomal protein S11
VTPSRNDGSFARLAATGHTPRAASIDVAKVREMNAQGARQVSISLKALGIGRSSVYRALGG